MGKVKFSNFFVFFSASFIEIKTAKKPTDVDVYYRDVIEYEKMQKWVMHSKVFISKVLQ